MSLTRETATCGECQKPLPRYYLSIWRAADDPPQIGQPLRDSGPAGARDDAWGPIVRVLKEETKRYANWVNAQKGLRCWKVWTGVHRGYAPFCTMRCALQYARKAHTLRRVGP